ncbi:hypothetical protein [Mucisphaera calidilacus]|uniref:Dockerin domain-containing protein n=1 Tax=Mucisphaera calidilacus TaxID=2527982 RepID=A0A518BZY0_9BACT|nr:hypothetical protein [Mucisphaera calidilacus]QDU72509.1 hypothetical protein Pan265_23780 [Mucisphaera calidilacus]
MNSTHDKPCLREAIAACLALASCAAAQTLPPAIGTTLTLPTAAEQTLFIPASLSVNDDDIDVLVHFHGAPATVNSNAAYAGVDAVVINVTYSGFSSAYSGPFGSDTTLFGDLLDGALDRLNDQPGFAAVTDWDRVGVSSFSAGYGAVREILKQPNYFSRIDGLLLADSLYASFTSSTDPTPRASQMAPFKAYAQAAATGSKTMIVSHSQVQTYTYANTAETADALMDHVGATPVSTQQQGLGTLDFYRKAQQGQFEVWGATGSDGDAHLEHLRYMAEWLDDLPFDDTGGEPGDITLTLADFEIDEGTFSYTPLYSGSNVGIENATADRTTGNAHTGVGSQRIEIEKAPRASSWMLRHTSGGAFPENNTPFPAEGWISFWLRTSTPGVEVQIGLDDPDSADLSTRRSVVADGQWHLYQWQLDDPEQWDAWATGDGAITGPITTIDGIFLHGISDATIELDNVIYSSQYTPHGLLGDADLNRTVDLLDLSILASHFGQSGDWAQGSFNGDGVVDLLDLSILAAHFGDSSRPAPEPLTALLLGVGLLHHGRLRTR